MATAQTLKDTHAVDDRVKGVEDKVLDVDDRVAGVDDKVAGVDNRVAGVDDRVAAVDNKVAGVDDRVVSVDNRVESVEVRVASVGDKVKAIDDKVAVVIDGAQLSSISHQENFFNPDVSRGKRDKGSHGSSETFAILHPISIDTRSGCAYSIILIGNQLRQDLFRWFSPPDPSINHNIACAAHHKRAAEWFFQGSIFTEWKSTGLLLWLHGKRTFPWSFQLNDR
jgi:hypothetical protein